MAAADLVPIRKQDLKIGVPLAYPVYDSRKQLLLRAGQVIQTEKQLDTLHSIGLFINPLWQAARPAASPGGGARIHVSSDADLPDPGPDSPTVPISKTLNQLKLHPGMVVYLQSAGDALKPKSAVKLIGWLEKTAVMVSAIGPQGSVLPFRDDELLQLKTIAGKNIVAFFAPVLKMAYTPYPHLHLAWPEVIQVHQLRKSLRVNTRLIVSCSPLAQPAASVQSARLLNLSAGGAMLESAEQLGFAGEEILIGLRLPAAGEAHTLSLRASVRNINEGGQPGTLAYGVEFLELPTAERLILEHYIYQTLLEN